MTYKLMFQLRLKSGFKYEQWKPQYRYEPSRISFAKRLWELR